MKKIWNTDLNISSVNKKVTLYGWVAKKRNLGGLIFIDLRDRSGIIQLVIRPENKLYEIAESLKNEYVIEVSGKVVERGIDDSAFEKGEHIAVAIIYIENSKGEFLIQKTSKEKGGIYSSTGGHVDHNEEPIDSIVREVKEELGLEISKNDIADLGYLVVDFPVRFVFYMKKDIDIESLTIKKDEVESVSFITIQELRKIINKGLMHKGHLKVLDRVLDYKNKLEKIK